LAELVVDESWLVGIWLTWLTSEANRITELIVEKSWPVGIRITRETGAVTGVFCITGFIKNVARLRRVIVAGSEVTLVEAFLELVLAYDQYESVLATRTVILAAHVEHAFSQSVDRLPFKRAGFINCIVASVVFVHCNLVVKAIDKHAASQHHKIHVCHSKVKHWAIVLGLEQAV
jgi:hypothetical protein